jgi:hypothetical protein
MKPLVLTPRAARWLLDLMNTPGLGVQLKDTRAATEAADALNAYVAKLPPPDAPAPLKDGDARK